MEVGNHLNLTQELNVSANKNIPWYVDTRKAGSMLGFNSCPDALATCIAMCEDLNSKKGTHAT